MVSSVVVLAIAIVLGGFIGELGESLFVYIQSLYAFFAPPFAAVFLLGILWRRINATGATVGRHAGLCAGNRHEGLRAVQRGLAGSAPPAWIEPYANQAAINWAFCMVVCTVVSLLTAPPRPEQVTDEVTVNWRRLNIFDNLGAHWYTSVVTWWLIFVLVTLGLLATFSGLVFPLQ